LAAEQCLDLEFGGLDARSLRPDLAVKLGGTQETSMSDEKKQFLAHLIREGEIDAYASENIQALNLEVAKPLAIGWAEKQFADDGGIHRPTTLYLKQGPQNLWSKEWTKV
jgi:hypothetical protein